ncbi:hypothetical protein SDC9_100366 [bioreactor metagenome]|uniref:Uncharacterized protein n=1 Tax=bioreactor metagenome TaxID=1076179 RepID=A0A645ALI6_9ZZZZ
MQKAEAVLVVAFHVAPVGGAHKRQAVLLFQPDGQHSRRKDKVRMHHVVGVRFEVLFQKEPRRDQVGHLFPGVADERLGAQALDAVHLHSVHDFVLRQVFIGHGDHADFMPARSQMPRKVRRNRRSASADGRVFVVQHQYLHVFAFLIRDDRDNSLIAYFCSGDAESKTSRILYDLSFVVSR